MQKHILFTFSWDYATLIFAKLCMTHKHNIFIDISQMYFLIGMIEDYEM